MQLRCNNASTLSGDLTCTGLGSASTSLNSPFPLGCEKNVEINPPTDHHLVSARVSDSEPKRVEEETPIQLSFFFALSWWL